MAEGTCKVAGNWERDYVIYVVAAWVCRTRPTNGNYSNYQRLVRKRPAKGRLEGLAGADWRSQLKAMREDGWILRCLQEEDQSSKWAVTEGFM